MRGLRDSKLWAYLVLTRPANLITAIADVSAGFAIGFILNGGEIIWEGVETHMADFFLLWIATIGLYGGGVVFNDVFDYELDKVERPERPLPSGKLKKTQAIVLGTMLFLMGILAAFLIAWVSGVMAIIIASLALLYDSQAKHHVFWGPLNMSLCRGGNLLLGVSVFLGALGYAAALVLFPILYIGSITLISQGEVSGGNKNHLMLAIVGYVCVFSLLFLLGTYFPFDILRALPFMVVFGGLVFTPLFKAKDSLRPEDIRAAVKAGVISLILLNASLASGFAGIPYGLCILLLLPVSMSLGKLFSVT